MDLQAIFLHRHCSGLNSAFCNTGIGKSGVLPQVTVQLTLCIKSFLLVNSLTRAELNDRGLKRKKVWMKQDDVDTHWFCSRAYRKRKQKKVHNVQEIPS